MARYLNHIGQRTPKTRPQGGKGEGEMGALVLVQRRKSTANDQPEREQKAVLGDERQRGRELSEPPVLLYFLEKKLNSRGEDVGA